MLGKKRTNQNSAILSLASSQTQVKKSKISLLIYRLHSLKDSRDDLPCSLLLVHKHDDGKLDVIGNSKVSKVHGNQKSVFIENGK